MSANTNVIANRLFTLVRQRHNFHFLVVLNVNITNVFVLVCWIVTRHVLTSVWASRPGSLPAGFRIWRLHVQVRLTVCCWYLERHLRLSSRICHQHLRDSPEIDRKNLLNSTHVFILPLNFEGCLARALHEADIQDVCSPKKLMWLIPLRARVLNLLSCQRSFWEKH